MGIDISMFFMVGDLNSIVFKSENSVGMEKITREDILANFSSGKGSHWVCDKGVFLHCS